eukprot:1141880-Pelagomonas_calceolata.AAC.1
MSVAFSLPVPEAQATSLNEGLLLPKLGSKLPLLVMTQSQAHSSPYPPTPSSQLRPDAPQLANPPTLTLLHRAHSFPHPPTPSSQLPVMPHNPPNKKCEAQHQQGTRSHLAHEHRAPLQGHGVQGAPCGFTRCGGHQVQAQR